MVSMVVNIFFLSGILFDACMANPTIFLVYAKKRLRS